MESEKGYINRGCYILLTVSSSAGNKKHLTFMFNMSFLALKINMFFLTKGFFI